MEETEVKLPLENASGMPPQRAEPIPGPLNNFRVLFQAADEAGCGGYRCILPVGQLRTLGAKADWTRRISPRDIYQYDAFVFQRPYDPENVVEIEEISRIGKIAIVESDDNLHRVDPNSPVFDHYKKSTIYDRCLHAADGLIVSTPELAQHYFKYNKNIVVAPNSIDLDLGYRDWTGSVVEIPKEDGIIDVMWRGGITHIDDLKTITHIMKPFFQKYPNTRLVTYSNVQLSEWLISEWGLSNNRERVHVVQPRNFCAYPTGLPGADIMIIPLKSSQFNDGKSELALAEAGALGIPSVASPSAAYRRFAGNNEYALLGNWEENLSRLIEDSEYREALGRKARARVESEYNLQTNIHYWVKGIYNIAKAKSEGNKGPGVIPDKRTLKKQRKVGASR